MTVRLPLALLLCVPLICGAVQSVVAEDAVPGLSSFVDSTGGAAPMGEQRAAGEGVERVAVRVRMIKATEPIEAEGDSVSGGAFNQTVEPSIRDLAVKLDKVAFRRFRLLSSVREEIGLKKKAVLDLPEGHSLMVRPLYVEGRRAGLWLKWLDRGGVQILDTRTHFGCGESLITGTDHAVDSGILLAIDVEPGAR